MGVGGVCTVFVQSVLHASFPLGAFDSFPNIFILGHAEGDSLKIWETSLCYTWMFPIVGG